jgi:hypothetical protein
VSYIHTNGVSERENLDILLSTTVSKLILDGTTVKGVEFATDAKCEWNKPNPRKAD